MYYSFNKVRETKYRHIYVICYNDVQQMPGEQPWGDIQLAQLVQLVGKFAEMIS